MMELEEMRSALNWQGVYQGRDCMVVRFEEGQAGLIQGLRANDQGFYLDFPEFQQHLVSFQLTRGSEHFQYWMLGDRLHRTHGPAKIFTDTTANISHMTFYQNGLKHNADGPAEIILRGHGLLDTHPRSQVDMAPDYVAEEFSKAEFYWFEHGESPLYPKPFSMLCEDGYRLYRTTGKEPVLDDFRGEEAFYCRKLFGNWSREKDSLTDDAFRLRHLVLTDYSRNYRDGEPAGQDCKSIDQISWIIQGEITETGAEKRETLRDQMFPEWNIWEGPLFPNEQEEVFAIGEMNS